jgi:hypothetical protein
MIGALGKLDLRPNVKRKNSAGLITGFPLLERTTRKTCLRPPRYLAFAITPSHVQQIILDVLVLYFNLKLDLLSKMT